MSTVRDNDDGGQGDTTDEGAAKTESVGIKEILTVLEAIVPMLRAISARLITIENNLAGDGEPPPSSRRFGPDEPGHSGPPPRLAVRDDGLLLLVLEDAEGRDLTGRVVIPCVVLTAEEQEEARNAWSEGAQNAACAIAGSLPRLRTP